MTLRTLTDLILNQRVVQNVSYTIVYIRGNGYISFQHETTTTTTTTTQQQQQQQQQTHVNVLCFVFVFVYSNVNIFVPYKTCN